VPVAKRQTAESFEALARRVLPPLVDEVIAQVAALGADVAPDVVKPLRKRLGKLRDHLDLFAPVFPAPRDAADDWRDRWAELRAAVDEGYGVLGAFKDLHDPQEVARAASGTDDAEIRYDAAALEERRAALLAWRARFVRPAHVRSVRATVAVKAAHGAWRRRSGLSARFWGTPGPKPDPERPALANLARLVRYRLREARKVWRRAAEATKLDERRARERFHDSRKRTRALVHALRWFPELVDGGAEAATPLLERLAELVRRQGKILDHLNADDTAGAASEWRSVRRWGKRHDLDHVLRELRRKVRQPAEDVPKR
jgi:hypothetical protein